MQSSSRYSGLCYNYGNSGPSSYNNDNNNYIENTFTIQTETFNAPTYQLHSSQASTPAVQQPQPNQQPQAILQNVFKPIVQAVVQPVNNLINTDYSFKSIFDRFKGVLSLQRVTGQPSESNPPKPSYQYYQQPEQQQPQQPHQLNQYLGYQPQQPADYSQNGYPSSIYNPQPQAPNYQNNIYQPAKTHSYSVATSNGYQTPAQTSSYHETQPSYQSHHQNQPYQYHQTQQPQQTHSSSSSNRNNNPFLTYDWSQLFNRNRK